MAAVQQCHPLPELSWVFWGPWTALLLMGTPLWLLLPLVGAVPRDGSLAGSRVTPNLSQLYNEMLEHPSCPRWGVCSSAVPGNGELMVLPEQQQPNQKREL